MARPYTKEKEGKRKRKKKRLNLFPLISMGSPQHYDCISLGSFNMHYFSCEMYFCLARNYVGARKKINFSLATQIQTKIYLCHFKIYLYINT